MEIPGKSALVTGSSKRLGRAIAIELGRRGARVAIHHRSAAGRTQADETLKLVRDAGGDGDIFRAELSDLLQVTEMFSSIRAKFGQLHILVNNASVFSPATADE